MKHPRFNPQRGVSLIEVLVSILIVSLGVLALAGLLGVSTKLAKTSEFRATSAMLAADIAERMRANRPGADAGNYAITTTEFATSKGAVATCATPGDCTAEEVAAVDVAEWQAMVYNSLPSGTGHVAVGADGLADVWIVWRDPEAGSAADNSDATLINAGLDANRCPPNFATSPVPSCMYFRLGL